MKGKKLVDKIKGKVKEIGRIFGDVAGALSPQPQLQPIPVRNPPVRRPDPRREYNNCGW